MYLAAESIQFSKHKWKWKHSYRTHVLERCTLSHVLWVSWRYRWQQLLRFNSKWSPQCKGPSKQEIGSSCEIISLRKCAYSMMFKWAEKKHESTTLMICILCDLLTCPHIQLISLVMLKARLQEHEKGPLCLSISFACDYPLLKWIYGGRKSFILLLGGKKKANT